MFITATADRGGRTGNKGCLLLARTGAAHAPAALEPAREAAYLSLLPAIHPPNTYGCSKRIQPLIRY